MSTPTGPLRVPESSGGMTTRSDPPVWTIGLRTKEETRRELRIDRAYTDAKVILILCGASSLGILSVACALWLAHWITR